MTDFNLQLFAQTQTTETDNPGNSLSAEMKTYYQDRLIDYAEPNLVYDQFGDKYPIPAHGGKTTEFRRYSPLGKAMTALTEGVTPDGNTLNVSTVTASVAQYGDYIQISDLLELTAIDRNLEQASRLLGSQAGRTLDTVTREVVTAGTNVNYAPKSDGTAVLTRGGLDATCLLTVEEVFRAAAKLRSMNAVPFGESYVAVIHPNVACDLMLSPKWVDVHKYADPEAVFRGEVGTLGGVRFVQSSEAKVIGASVVNAVNADTASSASFVLKTAPTAAALAYLTGEAPTLKIGSGTHTVASFDADTRTVTLTAAASLTAGTPIYSTDAGGDGLSVYCTMVFGANAYGTTEISGGGLTHIVKQLGSAGSSDPLNQRATTGWKATKAAERLVEEYMVRIEHVSSAAPRAASN